MASALSTGAASAATGAPAVGCQVRGWCASWRAARSSARLVSAIGAQTSASAVNDRIVNARYPNLVVDGYVVDCGSGHSASYQYTTQGGSLRELGKVKLFDEHGLDISLSDALKAGPDGHTKFIAALQESVKPIEGAFILIGATGGVRQLMDNGEVTTESIENLVTAMRAHWSDRVVEFSVLTGIEEAQNEVVAARYIARWLLGEEQAACCGFLSGGGMSCQLGHGTETVCLRLNTFEAQRRLEEEGMEAGKAWWEKYVQDQIKASGWADLDGVFIGTAMQASAAKNAGFDKRLVTLVEAQTAIREFLTNLEDREWCEAHWATNSNPMGRDKYFVVQYLVATRLRFMLDMIFAETATFFFSRTAEPEPGHVLNAEWTLGMFIKRARLTGAL